MNETESKPSEEMIAGLHASFRNSILIRETSFTPQIALLMASFGGYFYCLVNNVFACPIIFLIVTASSVLLALFGNWLCLLHGYQFRCDLYQLHKIEYKTGLHNYSLNKWPKYSNNTTCSFDGDIKPPNIIAAFRTVFNWYAMVIMISSTLVLVKYEAYKEIINSKLNIQVEQYICCTILGWIALIVATWSFYKWVIRKETEKYQERMRVIKELEEEHVILPTAKQGKTKISLSWCVSLCKAKDESKDC